MTNISYPNSPKRLGMNDALAIMNKYGGLTKSCRFAVRISPPKFLTSSQSSSISKNIIGDLTYLCEAVEMPGRGFVNADVRYYGPNQKLPMLTQYEDTTMTFLCRVESYERQFFDDWMQNINPTNSFNFNYRDQYETEIEIMQFAEYGSSNNTPKEVYRIKLLNAYPLLVNPQPMTWADDQLMRLAVTFTYHKWRRPGIDPEPKSGNGLIEGSDVTTSGGKLTKIDFII